VKKPIAILLILLLLFNALGFYGLFIGLRYKTTTDLVQRLDNHDYLEEETVTLKVPMAIPYHIDSEEYERVDGEIEHNGDFYRLVKQRLEKDTLYIVCIKDHDSKRIKQALTDYVKTFTDKPSDAKNTGKFLTSFIKDFLPTSIEITPASAGWTYSVVLVSKTDFFNSRSLAVVSPPPQS
jgi:hypothetical protein